MRVNPSIILLFKLVLLLSSFNQNLFSLEEKENFSLDAAINEMLSSYLGIDVERYSVLQASAALEIARSRFDTRLNVGTFVSERQSPRAASELDGAASPLNRSRDFSASLQRQIPTGANVGLSAVSSRNETNSAFAALNPNYTNEVALSLRQPLLRGRGPTVSQAEIRDSETNLQRSRIVFKREILGLLADLELLYYNVAFAEARRGLRESSLEIAKVLLEENKEREAVGLATRIDVLQAEAALATRVEELIDAEEEVQAARDALLNLLGTTDFNREFQVDPFPDSLPSAPSSEVFTTKVIDFDIDSRIQRLIIESSKRSSVVARNARLPNLDLILRGGYLGREGDFFDAIRETAEGRGYLWNAGLELSFPWGRREARARSFTAQAEYEREESRLLLIQQNTMVRARSALRSFRTALERVSSSEASLQLNQELFDRERARYESGISTFRNVLEAQQDLDNARFRLLQARFDTLRALVQSSELDGSLPSRLGIDEQLVVLLFQ